MHIIAHRGFAGLRVENTLAAFAHAIEVGAAGAELDVHLSRDGAVVVHHDDNLNPAYCRHVDGDWITPQQSRPIADLTHAELCRYDIGTPKPGTDYARRFERIVPVPDQHIPLLRDVIALAKSRSADFRLVIEIKSPPLAAAQRPWMALLQATLDVVQEEDFLERSILCSFDWGALRHARTLQPDLPTWFTGMPLSWFASDMPSAQDIPPDADELNALRTAHASGHAPWCDGYDPQQFNQNYPAAIAAAGGQAWFPWHRDVNAAATRAANAAGLDCAAWSVNLRDPDELARLASTHLFWLVTDYPAA